MATKQRTRINPQVYQQAAEWLVMFREGEDDAADRRRFEQWLRNSAECVRAYLEIAEIWKQGAALDPQRSYDADTLIAEGRRGAGSILPLTPAAFAESPPPAARPPVRRRWLAAAACVVAAAGLGLLAWMQRAPEYSTVTGEQRSFALADGSQVVLNSGTRIRVRFAERERRVELIAGQALFTVAKEPARPFVVDSGGALVRAVGTQFDVYRKAADTIVTVIEGKVLTESVLLSAGEQLTIRPAALPRQTQPDLAVVTAWTQRQLVFKGARLAEVAEEFNRYNDRKLSIEDPRLRDFHINGIFSSTDPTSMLNFLRMQPGISMREGEGGVVVTGAPPAD